jgi:hypothetical protein
MLKHNQDGAASGLLIPLIISVVLFLFAAIFGIWAYGSRQDYKNNVDSKISAAVATAEATQKAQDDANFTQQEKSPYNTYDGPEAYGSIVMKYPKTWSGYLNVDGSTNTSSGSTSDIDAYFNEGTVPSLTDTGATTDLHLEVLNQSYAQTLQTFSDQQGISSVAYSLPSLSNVVGVEISGQLQTSSGGQTQQTMVVLPDRSDTIELSTQGTQDLSDFNNIILKYFSFSP